MGPLVALAVAIVALLVSGTGVAATRIGGTDPVRGEPRSGTAPARPAAPDPPSTTAVPADPAARALAEAVEELSAFVEGERRRQFLQPVDVELIDGQAFQDRLLEDSEEDRQELDDLESVLQAVRLIDTGTDLFEAFTALLGDAVLGFYDTETGELVVRGGEITPLVRTTLVHELTHALDDQLFELDRPELEEADDESSSAFSTLLEGNAVRVEDAYEATISPADQEQALAEELALGGGAGLLGAPPVLTALLTFPYQAGPDLVRALLDAGGEARVDEALERPPRTSEQVAEPDLFLGGEEPVSVDRPAAGGELVDEGVYGYWPLLLTLADQIDFRAAARAAEGWGGDAYVAWAEGTRTCLRAAFAMDSPADLAELVDAWQAWASGHGDADVVAAGDRVTVTACG